jgi:hypothetical protein
MGMADEGLIAHEAFDLVTSPYGRVWPVRAEKPLPATDTRTIVLRRFRQFLSLLRFRRPGNAPGQTIEFRVPAENIHIEQPDNVKELRFPGIAILPGRGTSEPIGLGPPKVLEDTWNVYGADTVLVQQGEYTEDFTVEVWGSQRAERRALIAGISAALRSADDSYSTRIKLPEYYDRVCEFWLSGQQHIDDPDVVRGRRRGHLFVGMRVAEVQLINAVGFKSVGVDLEACNVDVDVSVSVEVAEVEVNGP